MISSFYLDGEDCLTPEQEEVLVRLG